MSLETFPDNLVAETTAGPGFMTDLVVLDSGWESRNANWSQALFRGELRIPASEVVKGQTLLKFFRAVGGGRANKFRMRDWSDYQVTNTASDTEGVFISLTATTFQAYKRYNFGSAFHERKITRLRTTPIVTGVTSPSWDLDTGILTVASGTPTAWEGVFDVPCRFDTDNMNWHIVGRNASGPIIEWESVPIVEVRE